MRRYETVLSLAFVCVALCVARADDVITNLMSPVVSYQYPNDLGSEALTNGGLLSPVASYQYPNDFAREALTNGGLLSPIASYQYFEWPGNDVLQLNRSPWVSYWYPLPGGATGVNGSFSRVRVSPASLAADGQSAATVLVTLLDGNGSPVSGKTVKVSVVLQTVGGAVALSSVTQPSGATDASGQAVASFTSTVAGTAVVSAQVVPDGVPLTRQPTVRFNSSLVAPGAALVDAITGLANSSSNLLTHSIGGIAIQEGRYGDYFQTQMTAEMRAQGVNAFSTGVKLVLAVVVPGIKDLLLDVAVRVDKDCAPEVLSQILTAIAGSSTGLTQVGQAIDGRNASLQAAELEAARPLLTGVPPATVGFVSAYQNDMALRAQANNELQLVLLSQRNLLIDLQQNSVVGQAETRILRAVFMDLNAVVTAAANLATLSQVGGKAAMTVLGLAESLDTYAVSQQNLNNDQQGYNVALTSLANCYYVSSLIDGNTRAAFDQIVQGLAPSPVTGSIISVNSVKTYRPLSGYWGDLTTWAGKTFAGTTYVHTDSAYSLLTVKNTGTRAATFNVNAFYSHTFALSDPLGLHGITIVVPVVASVVTNIGSGQSAVVRVEYFGGASGVTPDDGSPIIIHVLGGDGAGGLFAVDQTSSLPQWQQAGVGGFSAGPRPLDGPQPDGGGSTNLFGLETPIKTSVYPDPANQVYDCRVQVLNPFAIPLSAVITQQVPVGVTVVSTDGSTGGGWVVWTNTIATNGVVEHLFSFKISVSPGVQTNLPAPTVVFTDATGTNGLTMTATAAGFSGLFPVGVSGFVPVGTWGKDTPAQLRVTNYTAVSQTGTLAVALTDTNGVVMTNFSLPFAVGGLADTAFSYSLPGGLAPGSYAVNGVATLGGGTGRLFSETYVVSASPVWFGWGLGTGVVPDGFAMEVRGTAGYGYLIQCSTNLIDWQPLQYLALTNEAGFFTDYYAPYYGQRFYKTSAVVGQ